jgi:hypothetical protein
VKAGARDRTCSCWGKASGPKAALSYRVRRFVVRERLEWACYFSTLSVNPRRGCRS